LKLIPTRTPYLLRRFFSNYTWKKTTTNKTIYLTFDDGPTPEITNWTLNLLKQYNAKATFFCIGDNIKKYPDIVNLIQEHNHTIGNHTQNHIKGWKTNTKTYLKNVNLCQQLITKQQPNNKKLFRPPHGQININQAKALIKLGYEIIMWSVLTFDWDLKKHSKQCLSAALKAKSGDIVVMHDSKKATKHLQYILPRFLNHYSSKGYNFKAL